MACIEKSEHAASNSFDDVDLVGTQNVVTAEEASCTNNFSNAENETSYIPKVDDTEQSIEQTETNTDCTDAPFETVWLKDRKADVDAENLLLPAESRDSIIDGDSCFLPAEHVTESGGHSADVLSKVNITNSQGDVSDDSSGEVSTAVLTLDSEADSAEQRIKDWDLSGDDGAEVDVTALQLQVVELSAELDDYRSLYSQTKDEVENCQEQILEVCNRNNVRLLSISARDIMVAGHCAVYLQFWLILFHYISKLQQF